MNICFFGDIHLDAQVDGRVKNGIPIRVLDTYKSLQTIIDYVITNNVSHVIGTGDYYLHSRPSPRWRKMFHKFVLDLVNAEIQVVLIAGNHDLSPNLSNPSAISEFKTLRVPGVIVVEREPEVIEFDDFQLTAIPWQFYDIQLPMPTSDKFQVCAAHATVWGKDEEPKWEESHTDFSIPLNYFDQFDFTALGHIHKFLELNDSPPVIYPGSGERHTFGETDKMGFLHVFGDNWEHVPYQLRPQYDLREMPSEVDPEGMYRLTIYGDYDSRNIFRYFQKAFSFKVKHIPNRVDRVQTRLNPAVEMTPTEQLQAYYDLMDQDFDEETALLWEEILDDSIDK